MPRLVQDGISRKGCHEELLAAVGEVGPKRLIYVSYNPATFARDAKWLGEHGFS